MGLISVIDAAKYEQLNVAAGDYSDTLRALVDQNLIEITAHEEGAGDMLMKRLTQLRDALRAINGDRDMRRTQI